MEKQEIDQLKNWRLEIGEEGFAELLLDKAGSSVNVLDTEVFDEFEKVLDYLVEHPPQGLILRSAKTSGFLAGADVTEFLNLANNAEVLAKVKRGQDLFMRLRRLSFRTVAVIHGHCVGGGMELALACDYRVADVDDASLGLPEVKLGIHPGYGGVVRLTNLINPFKALTLMMQGRSVDGRAAKKLGLVDEAVQHRHLLTAAYQIAKGRVQPNRRRSFLYKAMDWKLTRFFLAMLAERSLKSKVREEHYPAPFQLLKLWRDLPKGGQEGMDAEAASFAKLLDQPKAMRTMRNLVRVFLLDREIRGKAKKLSFEGERVHVVGAGIMGGDIAAWSALRGFNVTLQDAKIEFIGPAIGRAAKLFKRKLKRTHRITAAMDRLVPDPSGAGAASADLVIEAITEKLEAKQGLYQQVEPVMPATALLATNTSSLPLEQLSAQLQRPGQLVGIHFFNPVAKMQLVEVVRGENSSQQAVDQALGFVSRLGKLPIEVASQTGFLVNRVLMAYLSEALRIYEEGTAPELIDEAALAFGMPMGPIELSDTVGLDICKAVAHELNQAFGGEDSENLAQLVEQGNLGRKTGKGFYEWKKGKPVKQSAKVDSKANLVRDRLVYSLLNESVQALAEGVVADRENLDIAMVFGTGFPPFLGGPMHYIEHLGKDSCVEKLNELARKCGHQFAPKPGWESL